MFVLHGSKTLAEQIDAPAEAHPVVLTPSTVVAYFRSLGLTGSFSHDAELTSEDSSSGNLNYW